MIVAQHGYSAASTLLVLTLLLCWCDQVKGQTKAQNDTDTDCVQRIINKYPKYKTRFRPELLQRNCQKSRVWKDEAVAGVAKAAKDPKLTPNQLKYFNQVTTCKGLQCLCDSWEPCRKLMLKLKTTFGDLNKLGSQLNSGSLGDLLNKPGGVGSLGKLLGLGGDKKGRRRRRQVDLTELNVLQKFGKAKRKEIRMMTDDERQRYFRALNVLKSEKVDNLSKYDILTVYHTPEYAPEAHFSAAFLPYHRELLKSFEMALRFVDPTVSMPYWDSTMDAKLPAPADTVLWTADFYGNGDGEVTTGPFANWTTIPDAQIPDLSPNKRIVRGVGQSPFGGLFTEADVQQILAAPNFRSTVYCVDPFLEITHGAKHMFIGGHMIELRISPNDPAFFLVHGWVDAIWELWRQSKQTLAQRESDYVSDNETCNQFAQSTAQMKPFAGKIKDGLLNKYVDEYFAYDPRPTCASAKPDCGSPYLFCDTGSWSCLAKIRANGNCTGLQGKDICYKGTCINNVCVPTQDPAVTTPTPAPTPAPTPTPTPPPTTPAPPATTTTVATTTTTLATTTTTLATTATQRLTTTPPGPPSTTTSMLTTIQISPVSPPPQNGTPPPVPATVWFPVTVLLMQQGNASTAYPKAKILTKTTNDKTYEGVQANPNDKPYYTGAVYAQMPNPFAGVNPVVVTVMVNDEFDKPCRSLCLQDETKYIPCQPKVTLDVDPAKSDNIPSTPTLALAKLLNWKGYHRSLDKFMFICDTQPATTPAPMTTAAPLTTTSFIGSTGVYNISIGNGGYINIVTTNDAIHQIANGGCHNLHRCCHMWANVGECTRNKWMQSACQWACNVCNPGENITSSVCADYHPQCRTWAADNQCKKNSVWMEENCRTSCNVCSRSTQDLGVLCGSPIKSGCKNYDDRCDNWSKQGECKKNPWWMSENCPLACKSCTP